MSSAEREPVYLSDLLPTYEPSAIARECVDNLEGERRLKVVGMLVSAHIQGYSALIQNLMSISDRKRQPNDTEFEREGALKALATVISYLDGYEPIKRRHLSTPLINLLAALYDVSARGVKGSIFQTTQASSSLPSDRMRIQATAAAWAEAAKLGGVASNQANKTVSKALMGYRLLGRLDGTIKSDTVKEWRKQARQPKPSGIDMATYDRMLKAFTGIPPEALSASVPVLLRTLCPHLFDI